MALARLRLLLLLLPLLRLRHQARLRLVALQRLVARLTCECGVRVTGAVLRGRHSGRAAGGALCFFLEEMPRLSATEPRNDRMPLRRALPRTHQGLAGSSADER